VLAQLADVAAGAADLQVTGDAPLAFEQLQCLPRHLVLLLEQRRQRVAQVGVEGLDLRQLALHVAVDRLVGAAELGEALLDQRVEAVLRIEPVDVLQELVEGVVPADLAEHGLELGGGLGKRRHARVGA